MIYQSRSFEMKYTFKRLGTRMSSVGRDSSGASIFDKVFNRGFLLRFPVRSRPNYELVWIASANDEKHHMGMMLSGGVMIRRSGMGKEREGGL
jgi:hypothetical protein